MDNPEHNPENYGKHKGNYSDAQVPLLSNVYKQFSEDRKNKGKWACTLQSPMGHLDLLTYDDGSWERDEHEKWKLKTLQSDFKQGDGISLIDQNRQEHFGTVVDVTTTDIKIRFAEGSRYGVDPLRILWNDIEESTSAGGHSKLLTGGWEAVQHVGPKDGEGRPTTLWKSTVVDEKDSDKYISISGVGGYSELKNREGKTTVSTVEYHNLQVRPSKAIQSEAADDEKRKGFGWVPYSDGDMFALERRFVKCLFWGDDKFGNDPMSARKVTVVNDETAFTQEVSKILKCAGKSRKSFYRAGDGILGKSFEVHPNLDTMLQKARLELQSTTWKPLFDLYDQGQTVLEDWLPSLETTGRNMGVDEATGDMDSAKFATLDIEQERVVWQRRQRERAYSFGKCFVDIKSLDKYIMGIESTKEKSWPESEWIDFLLGQFSKVITENLKFMTKDPNLMEEITELGDMFLGLGTQEVPMRKAQLTVKVYLNWWKALRREIRDKMNTSLPSIDQMVRGDERNSPWSPQVLQGDFVHASSLFSLRVFDVNVPISRWSEGTDFFKYVPIRALSGYENWYPDQKLAIEIANRYAHDSHDFMPGTIYAYELMEPWSQQVTAILNKFCIFEFVGASCCVMLGFVGGFAETFYDVTRLVVLIVVMRLELVVVGIIMLPIWTMTNTAQVLKNHQLTAAKIFGKKLSIGDLYISKLLMSAIVNFPVAATPWQTALVIGQAFRVWYFEELKHYQKNWDTGWNPVWLIGPYVARLGFPWFFAMVTLSRWIMMIRVFLRSVKSSEKQRVDRQGPYQRCAADACNFVIVSEVIHWHYAEIYDGTSAVFELLGIDTSADRVGTSVTHIHQYIIKNYGLQAVTRQLALHDRSKRFHSKTIFKAFEVNLKVSWLMLLLSSHDDKLEMEIQSAAVAIAMALFAVLDNATTQVRLICSLRKFRIASERLLQLETGLLLKAPWVSGTDRDIIEQFVKKAAWAWKREVAYLIITAVVGLAALFRTWGAVSCPSHIYGVTTGCASGGDVEAGVVV